MFLRAFDLIEFNGDDLRPESLINRKATLHIALAGVRDGIEINDHMQHEDGDVVFRHAKEGERNPDLLCERALRHLRAAPPPV